ncbi:dTDP-4-dehydrorhamnose 3,5-epimerase [Marispirochaeta sp.]|uniref:dTDP-4-dehydrorhamnose 3,5-epimerase n=1 Tax=Marispirochaeta sp. TaxID=2038653 RepID=UPI0029C65C75|nr:dTDP-4-dehydrorhamnose 3,5-epimerase [Marispirochaeta sp.]
MSRFNIIETGIVGLAVIERERLGDNRGFLSRLFCANELNAAGWVKSIAQINHTYTQNKGTVRGLHFQHPPKCEMKLVSCIRGAVFDVAVDLRSESPTFLQWYAEELSAENNRALLIPEGFAHGFQSLTNDAELIYFHSEFYSPKHEDGILISDPRLSIDWPEKIHEISARDRTHKMLGENFKGINV